MPFDPDRKEYLTSDEDRLKGILEQSLENDFILEREKNKKHIPGKNYEERIRFFKNERA